VRKIYALFILASLVFGHLSAELKYKQVATISSLKSEEDVKQLALEFLEAAIGDPDLKVIDIQYKEEKMESGCTFFDAIITCLVAQADIDIQRVQIKALKNSKKLN